MKNSYLIITSFLVVLLSSISIIAQDKSFLYGDALPDAPELAPRGAYTIGVRTLNLVHKNQVDVLNSKKRNRSLI